MSTPFPMNESVTVRKPGEKVEDPLTGNLLDRPGEVLTVSVFSWAVIQSVEQPAGAARTFDGLGAHLEERLQIIGLPDVISSGDVVILPNGSEWSLAGNAEDYNHNPWWSPGLVVYYALKVV